MTTEHLGPFTVIDFRRYDIKPGQRDAFGAYFEAYFPEAFQHTGAIIFGQFHERGDDTTFTWIRGFHDYEARAAVNTAFYSGPLWKEHSSTMNERIDDIVNTLLLQPVDAERAVTVLPAVDSLAEVGGASGVVVAHILKVDPARLDEATKLATDAFAEYAHDSVREAGVLVTLDVENNFPGLPFRTDGPYLVWLGIARNDDAVNRLTPVAHRNAASLADAGYALDSELLVLDPTPRSRLRWIP
jgi:hypothetical protein